MTKLQKLIADLKFEVGSELTEKLLRAMLCDRVMDGIESPIAFMESVDKVLSVWDAYDNGTMPRADELNPVMEELCKSRGTGK